MLNCVFVPIVDSFVNSQEWTTSRGVPDLKLVSDMPIDIVRVNISAIITINFPELIIIP